jgi:hypothetical protein
MPSPGRAQDSRYRRRPPRLPADPNGARIELLEGDVVFRTDSIEDGIIRSFDHYSVRADDLVAARDFYERRLGVKR